MVKTEGYFILKLTEREIFHAYINVKILTLVWNSEEWVINIAVLAQHFFSVIQVCNSQGAALNLPGTCIITYFSCKDASQGSLFPDQFNACVSGKAVLKGSYSSQIQ